MKSKPSLFKSVLISMILLSSVSILIIGYLWMSHEYDDFKEQAIHLRKNYIDQKKALIKTEVENAVDYINFKKNLTRERLRQAIKERVYEAHKTASFLYQTNKDIQSDGELRKNIVDALRTVRFFDNRNYYFIDDLDGNSVMYPPKPVFEGNNLLGIKNKAGVHPLPDIIKLVKSQREGYYIYNWVKYTEGRKPTDKEFPKITYYKSFEPFDWFIAVGEYLDYVEDDIQKEIFGRVANIKFGNKGSISISTLDGKTLVSDNKVWLPNQAATGISGTPYFDMLKSASQNKEGGFFQFSTEDQYSEGGGTQSKKLAFAMAVRSLEFIVNTSQPIDEIDQVIAQKRADLIMNLRSDLLKIILSSLVLILFTFLFARYFSAKTKKNFDIFRHFFVRASSEAASVKTDELNFQEFSDLAGSANLMVEARHNAELKLIAAEKVLKHSHDNLEIMVGERTAQLSDANKELDAFAYSVSHDLRAPLRGIDGFSLALVEDFEDTLDDTAKDYLSRIRKGCVRMGLLIDDMLQLSRLSRGKIVKKSLDLSRMASEILGEFKDNDPDREVSIHISQGIMVHGDATLIRAVLENLLGNAWKFTSKTEDARVEFGMEDHEGGSRLFVRDNGAGFDMAYVDKLFSAFQRLHSPHEFEGTGIGLATVQRIIHRHGGSIDAQGEVGKGASFYFTL